MMMIRVRYKGPTNTKGSRLIVTDNNKRKTYGFNAVQNDLEDHDEPSGYHDCCRSAAEIFIEEQWEYFGDRNNYELVSGCFGSDDFFIPVRKRN